LAITFSDNARTAHDTGRACAVHRVAVEMLKPLAGAEARLEPQEELAVEILSVVTATPKHRLPQSDAFECAKKVFPHLARLEGLYTNTGIETRFTCEPADWCQQPHGWPDRTRAFQRHALELLEEVAVKAVARAGIELRNIDAIVTNTTTGLAVPSLDAMLFNRLDLPETIERLPIFGLGCGGGVGGLAVAARIAQARPAAHVLFLTVELCTLCLRPNDPSMAMFVSAALFGDGAAGVVLRKAQSHPASLARPPLCIRAVGEHCWRKTEGIMGWDITEDGFGVVLSPDLPALLRRALAPALDAFLDRQDLTLASFQGFLFHPGGRKVLEAVEETLAIDRTRLVHSWSVLRDFGNMSSATVLFVLERALNAGVTGRHLLAAFGPGFSAYFVVADL
jgi:alkylresorcinol/alkylpyrone synthase